MEKKPDIKVQRFWPFAKSMSSTFIPIDCWTWYLKWVNNFVLHPCFGVGFNNPWEPFLFCFIIVSWLPLSQTCRKTQQQRQTSGTETMIPIPVFCFLLLLFCIFKYSWFWEQTSEPINTCAYARTTVGTYMGFNSFDISLFSALELFSAPELTHVSSS